MTRAFQKLQDLKNAANLAIAISAENKDDECYGNIFSDSFNKNHCKNCRNGIRNFLHMPGLNFFLQKHYVPLQNYYERDYAQTKGNDAFVIEAGSSTRANEDGDPRNLINNDKDQEKDMDQL